MVCWFVSSWESKTLFIIFNSYHIYTVPFECWSKAGTPVAQKKNILTENSLFCTLTYKVKVCQFLCDLWTLEKMLLFSILNLCDMCIQSHLNRVSNKRSSSSRNQYFWQFWRLIYQVKLNCMPIATWFINNLRKISLLWILSSWYRYV